jgi:hypothetical protein
VDRPGHPYRPRPSNLPSQLHPFADFPDEERAGPAPEDRRHTARSVCCYVRNSTWPQRKNLMPNPCDVLLRCRVIRGLPAAPLAGEARLNIR